MSLILHKGSSTNSGHYIFMIKISCILYQCDDVKITRIECNNICNSNTVYMLFVWQKKPIVETFKGPSAGRNGYRPLSELRRRHCNSILNRFLLKTSFHSLLWFTFVTIWFIALWKIQWRQSLYVHILCGLLSCDSSPICKKWLLCLYTPFTLLLMIKNAPWLWAVFATLRVFPKGTRRVY